MAQQLLFTEAHIGPMTLRNRAVRSAAFEGMGHANGPTQMLHDYHVSVARGGVGMTTLAYAAVCQSGLSFETQLWLRPEIEEDLRKITDDIHKAGAKASIQIGHCGNMTHRATAGQTPVGPSSGFNLYSPTWCRALRDDELHEIAQQFGEAVRTARRAGFDCVEVHAGHGYLISQFLSPYTNRRQDQYGGSLDNRMRFMRMCMEQVIDAAADDMAVVVKTNMRDGFKGGLEIDDCITVAKELERLGAHALVLSGGFVSKAPMYVMRGEMPLYSMTHYMRQWWLKYSVRMVGKYMIPPVPYQDLYFLPDALRFRDELHGKLIYVGGAVSREGIEQVLNEGFEAVQMGRALLRDPEFVNHLRQGQERCDCDHVNYCIARMYSREMACHKCLAGKLPPRIVKEIEQIKARQKR
ncbi:MAG: NADH:flavin oxidoreductase [Bacteroidales bacterium]|nr:NADH:flavin oxidoreductase [Bacteroidales bacterium]